MSDYHEEKFNTFGWGFLPWGRGDVQCFWPSDYIITSDYIMFLMKICALCFCPRFLPWGRGDVPCFWASDYIIMLTPLYWREVFLFSKEVFSVGRCPMFLTEWLQVIAGCRSFPLRVTLMENMLSLHPIVKNPTSVWKIPLGTTTSYVFHFPFSLFIFHFSCFSFHFHFNI